MNTTPTNATPTPTAVITGCARNISAKIIESLYIISNICNIFSDYAVIIVENDSTDTTPHILNNWARKQADKRHIIQLGKLDNMIPFRTDRLAFVRNYIMDMIHNHPVFSTFDYIINIDLKPKGFVQIACIFPKKQEKLGQAFVTKLKETGEKSKKVVNIQAVFVHPWSSDKIDIAAWKKSAVLSGADTMFILVSKANAASLKAIGNGPMNEIKSRIVFLEHIPMKTLYADIIVDFQRGK
jgi:hypothetical protein